MMNERIKELAEQAIAKYWPNGSADHEKIFENFGKFMEIHAELIVRECAEICMIEYDTGLEMAPRAPWLAKQIKDHFGVK